jgi:hypothetical protein
MGALEAEVERLQVAIDAVVPADDFPSASEAGGLRFWSLITGSERPDSADRKGTCTAGIGIFDDVVNDLGAGPDDWHTSDDWWADLLGHFGLFDAAGKGNEPLLHPAQR